MASDGELHQNLWRTEFALVPGPLTLDGGIPISYLADAVNLDNPSDPGFEFYADYLSFCDDASQSLPTPTAFDSGSSYEFAMSDSPFRTIDDAGDPSPLHVAAPFQLSMASDAWFPMATAGGGPQQRDTYCDANMGNDVFVTDDIGLAASGLWSPEAAGQVFESEHPLFTAFGCPPQQADTVSSSPLVTSLEATPSVTAFDPGGRDSPRQIPISESTSANRHGGAGCQKKRPRGRPRLYPEVDGGSSQCKGGALTASFGKEATRRGTSKTTLETAHLRIINRKAAKRYRDKMQTACETLEQQSQNLDQMRKSLQSDVRQLQDEVFQLKCTLLKCDCPLMRAHANQAASQRYQFVVPLSPLG